MASPFPLIQATVYCPKSISTTDAVQQSQKWIFFNFLKYSAHRRVFEIPVAELEVCFISAKMIIERDDYNKHIKCCLDVMCARDCHLESMTRKCVSSIDFHAEYQCQVQSESIEFFCDEMCRKIEVHTDLIN